MAEALARPASLREHPRSRTPRRHRSECRISPSRAMAQSRRRKSTSCASPFAVRVTPRRSVVGGPSVRRPIAGQGSKGAHRGASPHRGLCGRRVAAGSCQTETSRRTLVSDQLAAQVRRRHRPATGRRVCSGVAIGAMTGSARGPHDRLRAALRARHAGRSRAIPRSDHAAGRWGFGAAGETSSWCSGGPVRPAIRFLTTERGNVHAVGAAPRSVCRAAATLCSSTASSACEPIESRSPRMR